MAAAMGPCHDVFVPTVLIVDDHPTFRATAHALLEAAERLRPDVILLDVQLPDIDGFEVAARLSADGLETRIVLVSSRDGSDFGPLVERSGAVGFIPKAELSGAAVS